MGRSPCCHESGLKKGPWTPEEDSTLVDFIQKNGHGSWRALPKRAGLNRCGKSCRLRWTNYLRPDIKRGKFSDEEEKIIFDLHSVLGNKYVNVETMQFIDRNLISVKLYRSSENCVLHTLILLHCICFDGM